MSFDIHFNTQISFSGGRTSGYMLHRILEANNGLPDRAKVVFTNTGREMPQTLDFVQECAERWDVDINWIEYTSEKPLYKVVDYNTASRGGEPFTDLIKRKNFLPNQSARFCTAELKVRAAKRFLWREGWKSWFNFVGIRADEAHRVKQTAGETKYRRVFPLHKAGVVKEDVLKFWKGSAFDLGLPLIGGDTPMGNCDGCFLKSEAYIAGLQFHYPDRAKWWEDQEKAIELVSGSEKTVQASFSSRYTRTQVRHMVERGEEKVFNTQGYLCQATDGECYGD